MRIDYRTTDLLPYVNWVYFHHAWGVPHQSDEAAALRLEAEKTLARIRPYVTVRCVVEILPARSEGDDIVVEKTSCCECGRQHPTGETVRLSMLRQQVPGGDGYCLSLSDFVSPKSDRIGVFATSVAMTRPDKADSAEAPENLDPLMLQTLQDRLAEAAAEKLHEEVRRRIWGYSPDERLTVEELHREAFQGIRPAVGYPCLPDMSLNFAIDRLIDFGSIGVRLTNRGMMQPHASVSGLIISHAEARYFSVGKVDEVQLADYARRRGMTVEEMRVYLAANIQN